MGFAQIVAAHGTDGFDATLAAVFPTLEKVSVDYGIAEKADRVAVIPRRHRLERCRLLAAPGRSAGNGRQARRRDRQTSSSAIIVGVDTHASLIYSPDRLIATIGMDDIIVIDTPDATLICPKSRSEEVKKIVEELKARGQHHLL